MTDRPRLLDLFCCAGGAARGYADAGWDVQGVDIAEHATRYGRATQGCSGWVQTQWHDNIADWDEHTIRALVGTYGFDAIHASPPCQFGTALRHAPGGRTHANLIPHTRRLLETSGLPWVLENVDSDAVRPFMPEAVTLCGSHFGLGVTAQGVRYQLRRHRLFCTNWGYAAPRPCLHTAPVVGVYGGHARNRSKAWGGRNTADFVGQGHNNVAGEAMGIDWMTVSELSEAIPPAYTKHIGEALMKVVRQ